MENGAHTDLSENVRQFVGRRGPSQSFLEPMDEPQEVDNDSDEAGSLLCSRDKLRCNTPRSLFVAENVMETGGRTGEASDDDLQSEASSMRGPAPRRGGFSFGRVGGAAAFLATLAVVAIGGQRFGSTRPLRTVTAHSGGGSDALVEAAPRRMLVEHPEFVELIVGQVHALHGNKTKAWLRVGVASLCKGVAELLDKHLEPAPKQALYDVQLSDSQWHDLKKLLDAGRDPRVGQLGREGLDVIRRHMFESPARTDDRLQEMLKGKLAEVSILRDQLLPDSMSKLVEAWVGHRFGGASAGDDDEDGESRFGAGNQRHAGRPGVPLWRGMLNEQVLAGLRNGSSSDGSSSDGSSSELGRADAPIAVGPESDIRRLLAAFSSEAERRLQEAPAGEIPAASWMHPHLNVLEFSFSLAGLTMVSVFEVLFHIEYFDHNFRMPWWAWMLVIVPAEGGTVATCFFGLSLWCEIILGFIGLHQIELVMGLMIWHR